MTEESPLGREWGSVSCAWSPYGKRDGRPPRPKSYPSYLTHRERTDRARLSLVEFSGIAAYPISLNPLISIRACFPSYLSKIADAEFFVLYLRGKDEDDLAAGGGEEVPPCIFLWKKKGGERTATRRPPFVLSVDLSLCRLAGGRTEGETSLLRRRRKKGGGGKKGRRANGLNFY